MLREPGFRSRKAADQEPVRILLLEDDPQFADLLRTQLRRMRWVESRLEVAGTLAEALARLSREAFGLVLADLNLPDGSGLNTVEALARSGEQLIIVLTGANDPALRAGALDAGAYDFLSKDDLNAAALERLVRLASIQANTFRSLRESEARFRGLVHLSSDWYWEQDEQLRFTRLDGSVTERSGNDPKHAIGKRRWEIAGITPVSGSWDEHRSVLQARQPFRDFQYARIGDDGELRYVSASGEPVYDASGRFIGYRGLASDITLRKRAEDELRRFRLAMDTSADMILLIDRASMRHVDVNNTACQLLGYTREELLALGPGDLLPLAQADLESVYDRMIAAPQSVSGMRSYYRCKDGSQLPFESTRRVMRSGHNWIIAVISRDLRDRIASEKALEQSEARKAAILDAASDAIVTIDQPGRIVEYNAAAERMFGRSRADALGLSMAELVVLPGNANLGNAHDLGRLIEATGRKADGSRFDAELTIVRIPASEPPLFTATARDITPRKYEQRLLALEHAVTHCLADAEAAAEGIEAVMRAICESQGWSAGRFYRLDQAAGVLRFEVGATVGGGKGNELLRGASTLEFARGAGLPGVVWDSGEALWISDTATDLRVARPDLARDIGQHSALLFPVRSEGGIVGVISIASETIREPDERLRRTMELIGSQIGQFLSRKRAEEDLRRFRLAMDASADIIVLIDRTAMRFMDVNKTACALLGYSREEMLAMGPQDVLPVSRAQLEASYDALIADPGGAASRMNSYYRCRDGSRLPFESTRQVLRSANTWLVAAISRDIRERMAAEQALQASEARFRSLTELSSDMYWVQDREYRFTEFAGTGPLGERRDSVIGKRRWDYHYLNMTDADWAAHKAALDARLPFRDLELGRTNPAGEIVWVSVSGEPVFDAAGAFAGYRGVGKEITARKRAQRLISLEHRVTRCLADEETASGALRGVTQAICESEGWESARYFQHDEAAGVMRYEQSWSSGNQSMAQFNDGSRALVFRIGEGLVGHAWKTGEPLWVADVTKDERVANVQLARAAGVHGAFVFPVTFEGRPIGVLSVSSRMVREPDAHLLQTVRVIGSQVGQYLRRKQIENAVRESEARFRSLISLSSDWYWEQDGEFRFTKFEGKGQGEGRYTPAAAVLGKRLWDIGGIDRDSFDMERHRARLAGHESFRQLEYSYRDRSGRRFYVSVDGEPFFDERGEFAGYRGTSRDITAQRRREEELRRFRAAMDMSLDAIYLTDRASMRFVDVNQAACRGLGYAREQLLAMGPQDVLLAPKHELERAYDAVIARGEQDAPVETSYVAKDGSTRWTELHRRALRSGDGWVIVTISRDITERKLAEQRQAAHLHYQEKLSRFGQSALGRRQPAELVDEAVQTALEALGAEAVAYLEPGSAEGEVVLRKLVGIVGGSGDARAVALKAGNPVLDALASGSRSAVDGDMTEFGWARGLSVVLVPVRGDSRTRGALCVGARPAEPLSADGQNFLEAMASVLSTGLQRIDSEGRLAYLAQFDPLTGLPNRALLADRFSQMIVQARRHDRPLGVLFIDLDEFKLVNDTLGHAGGDELLKEVAVRLQGAVRAGDTVARISGDEFAVVLADLAQPEDAALVAQKIIERLAAPMDVLGQEVFVTASVGIAGFPGDGADAEALIGAADAAMYRAKQSGRNAYQFFTAEINQRSRARAQLGAELRRALEREEFALFYQPKFSLSDRSTGGAEALLRWRHPERGMVSPAEFIPVLEETGLIVPVGEWVLRRACEDLKAWRAVGLDAGPVAVNLSARQFRLADLDARLKAVVARSGVDPSLIELEITESQLMQDPDHAIRVMRSLREAGMRIAIDDFGTGYSSLAYLTRFPLSSLKIDRSFVASVNHDASAGAIVRTIIEMAHTLGFTVVAEGVETEAQAEYLHRHGCEQGQGYLFARPMPAQELAALLARHCS